MSLSIHMYLNILTLPLCDCASLFPRDHPWEGDFFKSGKHPSSIGTLWFGYAI